MKELIDVSFWGRIKLFFKDLFKFGFGTAVFNQRWINKKNNGN